MAHRISNNKVGLKGEDGAWEKYRRMADPEMKCMEGEGDAARLDVGAPARRGR